VSQMVSTRWQVCLLLCIFLPVEQSALAQSELPNTSEISVPQIPSTQALSTQTLSTQTPSTRTLNSAVVSELTTDLLALCQLDDIDAASVIVLGTLQDSSPLLRGQRSMGQRYRLHAADSLLELSVFSAENQRWRLSLVTHTPDGLAQARIDISRQCAVSSIRLLDYSLDANSGQLRLLRIRSGNSLKQFHADAQVDWINPPLVFPASTLAPENTSQVRVAMVDSGVNYQLPEIRDRLARDADGRLVGYEVMIFGTRMRSLMMLIWLVVDFSFSVMGHALHPLCCVKHRQLLWFPIVTLDRTCVACKRWWSMP